MFERATGRVAGHDVTFLPALRDEDEAPVAFEVSVTVPVSLAAVEAVWWILLTGGATFAEVTGEHLYSTVAETMANEGGSRIGDALIELEDARQDVRSPHSALAREIGRRVRQEFSAANPPAARRELAGVAR